MQDKFAFSVDELAKYGAEGRTKIFAAIRGGRLIARKSGRRTLILREDYEAYLKALPVVEHSKRSDLP